MSKLVVFFSLTGNNRRFAKELAKKENLDTIGFAKGGYLRVISHFLFKKNLAKKAKKIDTTNYQEIIIFGPIWGDKPAPAIDALLKNLDIAGKNIVCNISHTTNKTNITEEIIRKIISERNGSLKSLNFNFIEEKEKKKK